MRRAAVLMGLSCALLCAGSASAETVRCGQVLTRDTVVSNDLACDQTALVAGADGITIDLDRHRVAVQLGSLPMAGVDTAGHDGVRVVNGRIIGFGCGVNLAGDRNVARRLTTRRVGTGVCVGGVGNVVGANRIHRSFTGVAIFGGRGTVIEGNRIDAETAVQTGSGEWSAGEDTVITDNDLGGAVFMSSSRGVRVVDNRLSARSGCCGGITLQDGDERTVVLRNVLDGVGIQLYHAIDRNPYGGVLVQGNRISGAFTGISTYSFVVEPGYYDVAPGDEIVGNVVQDTEQGIVVHGGRRTLVRDNLVGAVRPGPGDETANGEGIRVAFDSLGVRVLRNRLFANDGDAVVVEDGAADTRVRLNVAVGNRGDGFQVDDRLAIVERNIARRNHGWGILASEEVEGGANAATRNLLGQCRPAFLC